MPPELIRAIAHIKWASALVNGELGLLDPVMALAIAEAARRVAEGEFDDQFPLSVWQTGSGAHSHMNVNEVVARLATLAMRHHAGAPRRRREPRPGGRRRGALRDAHRRGAASQVAPAAGPGRPARGAAK
jgi:Lyase